MPDDLTAAITKTAAFSAKEPRTLKLILSLAVLSVISAVVLFVLWATSHSTLTDLDGQVVGLNSQLSSVKAAQVDAAAKSQALADQVVGLGQKPVVEPAVPGTGPQGPQGTPGANGRGIASTSLKDGHLIVFYSDGVSTDVGQVAGAAGAQGVSISAALLVAGHLMLTYSDGHSVDVGQVVGQPGKDGATGAPGADGKAGRSVTSVANTAGRLIVTFSDGTTQDAGPLPVPADGRPPSGFSFTESGPLGRKFQCTPDTPADPGASPHYSCKESSQ